MILFYIIFILISKFVNAGDEVGPSYRSSVMEGDKPILRGGMPEEEENTSAELREKLKPPSFEQPRNTGVVTDLKLLLAWLMNNYGYEIAKNARRQDTDINSTATESPEMRARHAKRKKRRIFVPERRMDPQRAYNHRLKKKFQKGLMERIKMYTYRRSDDVLNAIEEEPEPRTKRHGAKESDHSDVVEPTWKVELKDFMKDLISRVSRGRLDQYARPVVKAVENKYHVNVADIDVDPFGHILIDYADLSNPKLRNRIIIDKGKRIIRDENAKRSKNKSKGKSHKHSKSKSHKSHGKDFVEWTPENYK